MPKIKLKGIIWSNNIEGNNMRFRFKDRDRLRSINKFIGRLKCRGIKYLIQSARHHQTTRFQKDLIRIYLGSSSRKKRKGKQTGTKMTESWRFLPMKFRR